MIDGLRDAFRSMSLLGKVAVLVGLAAVVVAVWSLSGVASAIMKPSLGGLTISNANPDDAKRLLANIDESRSFIDQKSSFLRPKAPVETTDPEPTDNSQTEPPKTYYAGPKLMGLSGQFAYFDQEVHDGNREIKIGQKGGTIELKRIIPPFKAVVNWQGKDWTLDLLQTRFSFSTAPEGDASGFGGFGSPRRSTGNPFTTRGSSPSTTQIFGEPSAGASVGGSVPQRRPPQRSQDN